MYENINKSDIEYSGSKNTFSSKNQFMILNKKML